MAISAGVAVGSVGDAVVEAVARRARGIRVGPGRDSASEMGPIITAGARDRITGLVDRGEQQGAVVTVDGRGLVVPGHEDGYFMGPTVLDRVTPDNEVYTTEVFGPVLAMLRADSVDDAIDLVNANPHGNGTAIFTRDGGVARRFVRGVQVGMVGVNVPVPVPMAYHSFGGWKDSLLGEHHVQGPDGVRFYTRSKVVTSRWPTTGAVASLDMPTAT